MELCLDHCLRLIRSINWRHSLWIYVLLYEKRL